MKNVDSLLAAAQALPPEKRAEFLDTNCGGDETLRQRIFAQLATREVGGELQLSGQATGAYGGPSDPILAGSDGEIIGGRYVLEEKLGAGGMGEVWAARQTEPVKRRVALKLIRAGADSQTMFARFEHERQALALMDHPHIAKVLDGGLTPDQRPFFVMELVNGQSLIQFCDKAQMGIRQRLELLVSICQAVQHAHQKGIIHRDLKPSNILVALVDGRPVPKVIDFGLAKATSGKITDETLATQCGAVLGTLEYMAPEQARASADVDTRVDIYALGVILYELLTGLRPFDGRRLGQSTLDEAMRILRDEEPPRPSKRLMTEKTAPAALIKQLRGELDWVVMKCLEKDRARRYETANALAREIERYLADEPVEARPPSPGYRLRKFVKRHKAAVLATAIVLFLLVGGIVGTAWGLIQAKRQERIATQNADAAIEVVHDLSSYVEAYEMGGGSSAATDHERKERLDAALHSYERLLELHPHDKSVRWHIARMHRFRANLCRFQDQTQEAEKSYQTSLRLFRGLIADFPNEIQFQELHVLVKRDYAGQLEKLGRYREASDLLTEATNLYEDLVRRQPANSNYQRNLALMVLNRSSYDLHVGKWAEAEQGALRSAELYAKLTTADHQPLDAMFHSMAELNVALVLHEQDRFKEADAFHRRAQDRMMTLTRAHSTRDTFSFYAETRAQRALTQARMQPSMFGPIADLRGAMQGWDLLIKQMGPNNIDLNRKAVAAMHSGRLKVQDGKRDEGLKDHITSVTILEDLVQNHPDIPMYRYNLGRTYMALGQLADNAPEANDWYRKARDMLDSAIMRYPENAQYRKALTELAALAIANPQPKEE